MKEIWKEVPGKPGMMASSLGRVRLPELECKMPNGGTRKYKTAPTTGNRCRASKTARHEYRGIYNRRLGNMKVHRLVCEAFHGPPPSGKPVVIHLNEDALDNSASNLKWGSQKENLNMPKFIKYCKSRTGENNPMIKGKKKKEQLKS